MHKTNCDSPIVQRSPNDLSTKSANKVDDKCQLFEEGDSENHQ